jgi:2-keto-4-pentenoate hydratase/2-oxohepta-3-ene-1,7-dioic acid hydratase in catechol pathway
MSSRGPRAGIAVDSTMHDLAEATGRAEYALMSVVLAEWDAAQPAIRAAAGSLAGKAGEHIEDVTILAPVLSASAIYCAGANYTDHVANMAQLLNIPPEPDPHEVGLKPWHFIKPAGCLTGDRSTIKVDSQNLDWEAELALVIGRRAKNVTIAQALNYVAGYTIANDLSARDLMRRANVDDRSPFRYDWIGQKCFDGSCPLGPWLVPAEDIGNPQKLAIKLWVNNEIKQNSNTSRMIFTAAEQISHLSSRITLQPGDIILTGTPAGVGSERGEKLKSGDRVRIEIEKIGELVTTIG